MALRMYIACRQKCPLSKSAKSFRLKKLTWPQRWKDISICPSKIGKDVVPQGRRLFSALIPFALHTNEAKILSRPTSFKQPPFKWRIPQGFSLSRSGEAGMRSRFTGLDKVKDFRTALRDFVRWKLRNGPGLITTSGPACTVAVLGPANQANHARFRCFSRWVRFLDCSM